MRWPACGAEDPPDGCRAEVVAEPREFAVHTAVAPGGVLPGQPQDQVADLLAGRRAAGLARVGPLALDEAAVPGEQRARRDQAMAAQPGGQQAGQRGQDRAVGPVEPGPGDLAAQDGDLVAEDQDLGVLRRLAAAEQLQPAKDPDDGEVQDSHRHRSRSCLIAVSGPNRTSRPLRGVLEQYRRLLGRLDEAGRGEEAENVLRQAVEAANGTPISLLAEWLGKTDRPQAERLRRYGMELGGATAAPW
jgi:hypothetical protein